MQTSNRVAPLITIISVFYFWGFVAASNAILIPTFKAHFSLSQFQSQLVDFAFFIAYFIGGGLYFLFSYFKGDPLNKIGYKNGLIIGLFISSIGAIGFIPAASTQSYPLFLVSLFTIGFGFALQQIVANPYVIALGDPETGSQRLNLAGGINSFGTTIGPVILSYALFGTITSDMSASLDAVKIPALILCALFLISAALLYFSNLPPVTNTEKMERDLGALKYPQLTLGMIAIFVYVGVEVTIQSNLAALIKLPEIKGLDYTQMSHFISLYWGSLMIGRWTGALKVFDLNKRAKGILTLLVPIIAFGVIYSINYIRGSNVEDFIFYIPFIAILVAGFFVANENPSRTLIVFGSIASIMMVIGIFATGDIALYSFISGGLFCSVMWPCIFTLAIAGLGKYTTQGSALLIMMILGGALIPPIQGLLIDMPSVGAQHSYIVAVFCFLYLAYYGWRMKTVLAKQGIDAETGLTTSH